MFLPTDAVCYPHMHRTLLLGFTLLPAFVAKNVVTKMLNDNYCLDTANNRPVLAKAPKEIETEYMYASDLASYMLVGSDGIQVYAEHSI